MRLEVQLEDVVLVDVLRLVGYRDGVAQQGKASQRIVILETEPEPPLLLLPINDNG